MPKGSSKEKAMAAATKTVNVVTCVKCGTMHLVDSDDFVVVYGNISIGMKKPIIDGNIDEKGKLIDSQVYCRTMDCLGEIVDKLVPELTRKSKSNIASKE